MQRCGPSGMFLLSACFGMFAFGMFKRFLLSACYVLLLLLLLHTHNTHTHHTHTPHTHHTHTHHTHITHTHTTHTSHTHTTHTSHTHTTHTSHTHIHTHTNTHHTHTTHTHTHTQHTHKHPHTHNTHTQTHTHTHHTHTHHTHITHTHTTHTSHTHTNTHITHTQHTHTHPHTHSGILRGRRGTWRHSLSLCVAESHIYRRFVWPAWDRWHWVARLDWFRRRRDAAPLCVAGVALGDIHLDFTWQAWHNLTSTVVLRGRRGTDGTGWRAWTGLEAAVTPVTPRHFCVAGVALGDIHLDFTWQAWHNLTSTVVLRGRRGTDGTGWRAWTGLGAAVTPVTPRHFCVAGVALGDIHLDFTWQAWHNLTSTVVLRGRRAWQAWHLVTSTLISRGRRVTTSHLPSFCEAGVGQMALGGALGLV